MTPEILVIDDELAFCEMICEIVELNDLNAVHTTNANDCEEILARFPSIELIFLDLNMPERDGIEVLRALSDTGYQGQIVVMSGYDESVLSSATTLARQYNLNLLEPLAKPFSMLKLSTVLKNIEFGQPKATAQQDAVMPSNGDVLSVEKIRELLENNQLEMHYQPKICTQSQNVVGVEALVRLICDDYVIYPKKFISVIEAAGLHHLLLDKVLDAVFADYKTKLSHLDDLSISVNISSLDLDRIDLPDLLAAKTTETNFPRAKLIIEVTETYALRQVSLGLDILSRLRLKGFMLSIDDFGTGAAVLENIRNLPYRELKIDKTFVDNLVGSDRDKILIRHIIDLAHNFGMNVVAEGVETKEVAVMLKEFGCDQIQGYYFSKPLPAEKIAPFIQHFGGFEH